MKLLFKYKLALTSLAVLVSAAGVYGQEPGMQFYKLNEVRLLKSPFKDAEETDLRYMLKLNPDRLLAPFLRAAGLKPRAESYGNWENTGLDGHTGGHYLTALAQMYVSTGSLECKKRLNYMVAELARCQKKNKNGYVGGVPDGNNMWRKFKTGDFSEFYKEWVPWYNLHKLFAGLRDCYLLAGNEQAKSVFLNLCDWANDELSGLSDSQIQTMLGVEQGGMNEVIADAYAISGDRKFLVLAKKFSHQQILVPLEDHRDELTGLHANTQIPKVIGFERIAQLSGDTAYGDAARFFWQTVVTHRSISIGGNSVREHFNPADNFAPMLESEQGPETCNSYNMLKLSKMLFMADRDRKYIDFYERLLYNHILSSQHPGEGGFVYFTPIHPQHYRVYSTADESFWCCVGTGMENHGKYGELIYTHMGKGIYVNLFIPSVLNSSESGIRIVQQNNFPYTENSLLTVTPDVPKRFSIFVRKPLWVNNNTFGIKVNGKAVKGKMTENGYVEINRVWRKGDKIRIDLPMKNSTEYLPDHSGWVSFLHGPIVLAAPVDTTDMPGLFANGDRWAHIARGKLYPLSASPLILETKDNLANHLIKEKGNGLQFEIPGLIAQEQFRKLTLVPFFQLHDARYMIYWPVAAKDSVKKKESELAIMDENYIKLAPRTLDEITPGEQQPENDHQLKFKDSNTGYTNNTHWRSATGMFSYNMRHSSTAKMLRVSYMATGGSYDFDIYVNRNKIAHISNDNQQHTGIINREFPLPAASTVTDEPFLVEIVAADNSKTAQITDIRLLK